MKTHFDGTKKIPKLGLTIGGEVGFRSSKEHWGIGTMFPVVKVTPQNTEINLAIIIINFCLGVELTFEKKKK